MAILNHVPEKVITKKTVVQEEAFVLTLNKDEALLLLGLLGATSGTDKWGNIAYQIYDKLEDCKSLKLCQSPYNLLTGKNIKFTK